MAARISGRKAGTAPGTLRIAMAQVEPVLGDLKANVAMHLKWARRARQQGARLVVFPELSLTGYRLQDLVDKVAVRLDAAPALAPLLELSRNIAIAVGLVEESEGHRYYNSALFLEGGRLRHVHRKVYLPDYGLFEEGRYFAAGDTLRAFRTGLGRVGMLVCEDLWHPATALVLAQDGADYLLVLANGPTRQVHPEHGIASQQTWKDLVKVTAQLQTVFVACVNRVGYEDGVNFSGGSSIVDPLGRTLAQGKILEEELIVCDLERATLRRARTSFPFLRDERLAMLSREVQRLLAVPVAQRGPGGS